MKEESEEYTGFQALYLAALDSDVSLVTGVPGYPITSLMELFLEKNGQSCDARWLTNEKVALEIALGASVSGRRTLVLVKHVGMNLLSDPLITSVTHTIGAGLVIIAGDDPGAKGSQNEQDSRWYGRIAEVAVFDPTDSDTAYRSLIRAYELSEETKTPVILRVTSGLEKGKGRLIRLPRASAPHPEFDRSIWKNRMMEKHRLFHSRVYPLLEVEAENTDLNRLIERPEKTAVERTGETKAGRTGKTTVERIENITEGNWAEEKIESFAENGTIGIISSGFMSSVVEKILEKDNLKKQNLSEISHLSLSLVNPLPLRKIGNFLKNNKKVLVIEESETFIEEQIRISGNVYGKKTGHLPYGQVIPEDIEFALEHMDKKTISKPEVTSTLEAGNRGRTTICDNCPYLPLYRFLSTLDVRIAGDMGCSVRSAPEPLAAVDVSFALGSAISVACGFEIKGIAVIGDFALAHSGILGLLSAANAGFEVLVLVLHNEVAAMTGGQEVPNLIKVVKAIVTDVSVLDIDEIEERKIDISENMETENMEEKEKADYKEEGKRADYKREIKTSKSAFSEIIREKLALPGISVIFIKGKCKKY